MGVFERGGKCRKSLGDSSGNDYKKFGNNQVFWQKLGERCIVMYKNYTNIIIKKQSVIE